MWVAIIAIVVAVLVAVFYKPKTPELAAQTANAPEVLDGRKIRRVFGTVWIEDPMVLGWKPIGTVAIKAKGK
jgi:hypothetical protein